MTAYFAAAAFLSMEPLALHFIFFSGLEAPWLTAALVYFQSFILFGLLLTFPRRAIAAFLSFLSVIFAALLLWHKYYEEPLSLQIICEQFSEGMIFLRKAPFSIFSYKLLCLIALTVLQINYFWRFYRPPQKYKKLLRLILGIPLAVFLITTSANYHRQVFSVYDFKSFGRFMGYAQAWWYETWTSLDRRRLLQEIVDNSRLESRTLPEFADVRLPEHIFIVQVESLDWAAMEASAKQEPVMPFLQSLKGKSILCRIAPRPRAATGKYDFSGIVSSPNYNDYYSVIYYLLTPDIDAQIKTLPRILREKGYVSRFYHGFSENFYERGLHIKNLGFDEAWFEETLPISAPKGEWGFHDKDVVKVIANKLNGDKGQKTLDFFVTVSSHEPYTLPEGEKQLFNGAKTEEQQYLNMMHYVDSALQDLVIQAPQNSLFVIYSDHQSEKMEDTSTILIVYAKNQNLNKRLEISFSDVPIIIRALIEKE